MKSHASAFTLLELVIALAIAAILTVFAVPSYRSQVARSHRVDAASALYRAAQFMEAGVTNDAAQSASPTLSPLSPLGSLPAGLDQAPPFGTAVYRLRTWPADDTNGGYTLEASPVESGPMHDDACGTFVLDATGLRTNRTADGSAVNGSQPCWNAS